MTMKGKATAALAAGLGLGLGVGLMFPADAAASKPNTMKGCLACHQAEGNVLRGKSVTYSEKFGTIQVDVGPLVWIVKFDQQTLVKGADSMAALTKDKEIAITYKGGEKSPVATIVSIKEPFKLPEEKLVSVEEMQALAALGPEKGGYLLVDSRPAASYLEGHLPTAVSIPFPALQEKKEALLPADKDRLLIFYCGGFV
jgi:hypothetical protein